MTPTPRPPRLARLLARLLVRSDAREIVIGDLDEEFARAVIDGVGPARARRKYWRQALASIAACGAWRRPILAGDGANRGQLARFVPSFAGVRADFRYAGRALARTPTFSLVTMVSLAIGIGANTTVYNVIRVVLLETLPVERPHELALLYWDKPSKTRVRINQINGGQWRDPDIGRWLESNYTYPMFTAMRRAAGPSADLIGFNVLRGAAVSIDGRPPVVAGGLLVSGDYFTTLQVRMALGRPLAGDDDRPGAPPVAVLGHGFWTRTFGADPAVIGTVIRVNGAPCEVVGVTAPGFRGLSQGGFLPATDITVPLAAQPLVMPRWTSSPAADGSLFTSSLFWIRVIARVPVHSAELQQRLDAALRQEYARLPGADGVDLSAPGVRWLPGARGVDAVQADVKGPLRLLAGVAAIVLLMACLNVSALLLARGVARERELAVRRALGAGRGRVMQSLLTESVVLAVAGGMGGVLLAVWAGPIITSMLAIGVGAGGLDLGVDWPLIAIAAALALAAALVAGVIPALRLTTGAASLTQRSDGNAKAATGRALVALQIAVSLPLLVGAGLLLRTLHNLGSADLGFNPAGVVVFRVDPRLAGGEAEQDPLLLYTRVLARVGALPGVVSAALVENALVSGRTSNTDVFLDGVKLDVSMNAVGPGFFETMGVPIVAGRPIGPEDGPGAPPVIVINQIAAARYFPNHSPIGRRLTVGRREVEIVGIAGDALYRNLRTPPRPMYYDSYAQRSFDTLPGLAGILRSAVPSPIHVVLRTRSSAAGLVAAIPAAVREVAPEMPVTELQTHVELIEDTIARERMFTRLLVVFGGFAVLLGCIGLHGVTTYSIARRTSEIGIRVALGAQRGQVVWLILRQVLVVAVAGVALGVPIAVAAGPVMASLLFGLAPRDALTIAAAAALMLAVALAAGWLPARRAARLPVLAALRRE